MTVVDAHVVGLLAEATARIATIHDELRAAHPALEGTMAVPGMLLGYAIACLISNGMSDEQIAATVTEIIADIRGSLVKGQASA